MPKNLILFVLLISFCFGSGSVAAQDCAPPAITIDSSIYNIFSPEQEMLFGELTYQHMAGDMRFVRDPELEAYLRDIGAKLVRHLPETGLKFQFFIVDLPDANAFNIPGGYVFVSRKLIGFANNEDELAGVIAHELGHATVRHAAADISSMLKAVLNVTQLGDRKDVIEKYNLLLDRQKTKTTGRRPDREAGEQLQADRIGLFAMIAAGYDPNSFASMFGRLVEQKPKAGNWFTDLFAQPKPAEKRLREMARLTEKIPPQCRAARPSNASETFLKWQAAVVSYRDNNRKEDLAGLVWKRALAPKLRSDISHFAFSPNGKLFLAQDDFAITVIQRAPLQVLFQIPATESRNAEFTPDGQFIVFGSENLRYEKWSVADQKPIEIRELVVHDDCWEQELSPDGKYMACVDRALGLNVVETQGGKKVFEKKDFYRLDFFEWFVWVLGASQNENEELTKHFFNIEFSPDSHFLAVSRSFYYRATFGFGSTSPDTLLALDLTTLKPVDVGGDFKKMARRPFMFLDSQRILAMAPQKVEDGGIFSFPEGKRLAKFAIGGRVLQRTMNSNYVMIKPLINARIGIFDVNKAALVGKLTNLDAAIWENIMVHESLDGSVLVSEITYDEKDAELKAKTLGSIDVPVASMGRPLAADLSDNLQWLAISSKTRGAMWNLGSGERKMYVRGFRGALVGGSGDWIADFPKYESVNHALVLLKPAANEAGNLRDIPEKGARQYRRFLLTRQSLKPPEKSLSADNSKGSATATESNFDRSLGENVRFELSDLISSKVVWSADYAKEAPGFFFDEFAGRLVLYWTLNNEEAKAKLKANPALAAQSREMGNKDDDYLVEVIDALAGKTLGTLLLETGKGSFYIEHGFSEGDWLVIRDSENRVLAYSIKDGTLRNRFFGSYAAINPARNQIVVENYPGELTFYDLTTGETQTRLSFPGKTAFLRFALDGKKLFVLNSEQTAYLFDTTLLKKSP
jgi:hypothetical protein